MVKEMVGVEGVGMEVVEVEEVEAGVEEMVVVMVVVKDSQARL